jgi:hypothetical protein
MARKHSVVTLLKGSCEVPHERSREKHVRYFNFSYHVRMLISQNKHTHMVTKIELSHVFLTRALVRYLAASIQQCDDAMPSF